MVVNLDGIERLVVTENPETGKQDSYICSGYRNTGKGLVDMYRPLSGSGEHHSLEYLKLCAKKYNRPIAVYNRGQ